LFTAGGVMLVVFGLVRSLSLIRDPVAVNDTERQLLELATNYKFNLTGSLRSMAELWRGFSIAFLLSIFGVAALAWKLTRFAPQKTPQTRTSAAFPVPSLWFPVSSRCRMKGRVDYAQLTEKSNQRTGTTD
jgi:hypothetical protein